MWEHNTVSVWFAWSGDIAHCWLFYRPFPCLFSLNTKIEVTHLLDDLRGGSEGRKSADWYASGKLISIRFIATFALAQQLVTRGRRLVAETLWRLNFGPLLCGLCARFCSVRGPGRSENKSVKYCCAFCLADTINFPLQSGTIALWRAKRWREAAHKRLPVKVE